MSTVREPLPYPHEEHPHFPEWDYACQHPERPADSVIDDRCPGCRAYRVARAVMDPHVRGLCRDGEIRTFADGVRWSLDEFDPMRVHFERALAARLVEAK